MRFARPIRTRGDILTFSLPPAPAGMSIDASSGLIDWMPAAGQLGAQNVIVKVSDVRGLYALQEYAVHVAPPITVPDIVGQPQATAETAIAAASLTTGGITSQAQCVDRRRDRSSARTRRADHRRRLVRRSASSSRSGLRRSASSPTSLV